MPQSTSWRLSPSFLLRVLKYSELVFHRFGVEERILIVPRYFVDAGFGEHQGGLERRQMGIQNRICQNLLKIGFKEVAMLIFQLQDLLNLKTNIEVLGHKVNIQNASGQSHQYIFGKRQFRPNLYLTRKPAGQSKFGGTSQFPHTFVLNQIDGEIRRKIWVISENLNLLVRFKLLHKLFVFRRFRQI